MVSKDEDANVKAKLAIDEDVDTIMKKAMDILSRAKSDIMNVAFEGYEPYAFSVSIDLKLTVEDRTIRVHEKWTGESGWL